MKLLLLIVACFSLALAAPTNPCYCEEPICPMELKAYCECHNAAATTCHRTHLLAGRICPLPRLRNCALVYAPVPKIPRSDPTDPSLPSIPTLPSPPSLPTLALTLPFPPRLPSCTCEPVMCAMSWPESCYCQNNAALACARKCGGEVPEMRSCAVEVLERDGLEGELSSVERRDGLEGERRDVLEVPKVACICENTMCVQSYPESCYCENAKRVACARRCGVEVPTLMDCRA